MDKKLFIANWKSHKTEHETLEFLMYLKDNIRNFDLSNKELIIAPPFTQLSLCKKFIDENSLPIQISSQNVSSFPEGAYTGEISARQIKEYVQYAIVGHSERRKYLHESDTDIDNKIREAKELGILIIQCIQDENSTLHKGAEIIAYEPPTAIGTGNPDDPNHIAQVFRVITEQNPNISVIYGGSVNPENIKSFLQIEKLSGFLVGGASLDAKEFLALL